MRACYPYQITSKPEEGLYFDIDKLEEKKTVLQLESEDIRDQHLYAGSHYQSIIIIIIRSGLVSPHSISPGN